MVTERTWKSVHKNITGSGAAANKAKTVGAEAAEKVQWAAAAAAGPGGGHGEKLKKNALIFQNLMIKRYTDWEMNFLLRKPYPIIIALCFAFLGILVLNKQVLNQIINIIKNK